MQIFIEFKFSVVDSLMYVNMSLSSFVDSARSFSSVEMGMWTSFCDDVFDFWMDFYNSQSVGDLEITFRYSRHI